MLICSGRLKMYQVIIKHVQSHAPFVSRDGIILDLCRFGCVSYKIMRRMQHALNIHNWQPSLPQGSLLHFITASYLTSLKPAGQTRMRVVKLHVIIVKVNDKCHIPISLLQGLSDSISVVQNEKHSTSLFNDYEFLIILLALFGVLLGGGLLWEYFYYRPKMERLNKVNGEL